jgi:hypothetical protein
MLHFSNIVKRIFKGDKIKAAKWKENIAHEVAIHSLLLDKHYVGNENRLYELSVVYKSYMIH